MGAHVPGSQLPYHRCSYCTGCRETEVRAGAGGAGPGGSAPSPISYRGKLRPRELRLLLCGHRSLGKQKDCSFLAETSQVQIPGLWLAAWVTFGESLKFSVIQFPPP